MNVPTDRIIEELSRPEAYLYPVKEVRVVQTHISVVFLAGDRVYKVKKPVDFGFLDFTTLSARKHFCEEELRLNRRLSPDTYLDVVPVLQGRQGLRFGGKEHAGEPALEYAVVMKRLDESMLLSELLKRGEADAGLMDRIAARIASFHEGSDSSPRITETGGTKAVLFNTEENFSQIEPFIGRTLDRETFDLVAGYTRTFLDVNGDLFSAREREGWIRDGHGDLHSQHICLSGEGIEIFDCIEFNERFRFGDVLADAAFLAMDLTRLGHGDLAERYSRSYLGRMGQEDQMPLFNFYACYRAVVRGKVEGFRYNDPNVARQEAEAARESARAFHMLAGRYARSIRPAALVLGCGLMGSGKSTVAAGLGELLDLEIISSDVVRKEMAGIRPTDRRHVPFGEDIYSPAFTAKTYSEMHRRALDHLRNGRSVFLDASYMDPAARADAARTAGEAGARFIVAYLRGDEESLRSRLVHRGRQSSSVSDGRAEILADQAAAFVEPEELSEGAVMTLDAAKPAGESVRQVYRRLLRFT